ncbi:GNAT family N-acetyltransferase [Sediminitomix flava]|uniref:Ribosomal protein S18 acetylase RimI-like enzyme n=1 Tax=Sediminitomix flava TaxID=379075 RepID=A0A315ZGV5_SEDFL|nr:GNAT family N-acetyltransferase [Sediminitomix flava]PWJ43964.1 ribosomal protein S18 acetylase RimI-like enzyme [Sediminitomix flava]
MITLKRTDASNLDFKKLVQFLDIELAIIDGDDHSFYAQYNKTDHIKSVVVAYNNGQAVGCGAIKEFDNESTEVKRMYVDNSVRNKGIASLVLKELENWASELGYKFTVLETGLRQQDAIALYQKNGYQVIPNYGQYIGVDNSRCFQKELNLPKTKNS